MVKRTHCSNYIAETEDGDYYTKLGSFIPSYEFVNSSEFDKILSSFPLAESVESSSNSSESSSTDVETSSMSFF